MTDFSLPQDRPPSEEEMNVVRNLFAKAADAIVNASVLGKRVKELEQSVSSLTAQVESMKSYNEHLIEEIANLRNQKQELQTKINEMQTEVSTSRQQMAQRDHEIGELQSLHNSHVETIARLQRESDDWMQKHTVADSLANTFKAKLRDLMDLAKDVDILVNPPAPPVPEVPVPEDFHNPVGQLAGTGQAGDGDQSAPVPTEPTHTLTPEPSEAPEAHEEHPWPAIRFGG